MPPLIPQPKKEDLAMRPCPACGKPWLTTVHLRTCKDCKDKFRALYRDYHEAALVGGPASF